jgi:hypothetical protein
MVMKTECKTRWTSVLLLCVVVTVVSLSLSCGSDPCSDQGNYATVSVGVSVEGWTATSYAALAAGPVDPDTIETFLIIIDRIILNPSADDDSLEGVVVFDATEQPAVDNEIDLKDLSGLHEMVSGAEVPAGDYEQVRMEISNPRLRLVGDPAGEYRTNIKRTANGRLFAGVELSILPDEVLDLNLVLNSLHLVEQGNGDFVLTPQLRVEIITEE